jgi:hypothetical protein
MPTGNLRSALNDLASNFASAVLDALKTASLDDLVSGSAGHAAPGRRGPGRPRGSGTSRSPGASPRPKRRPNGRLARRSPEQIAKAVERVVALVKKSKDGLRSEQIRAELKLDKRELPRVLGEGLAKKVLKSKGQKRATRYFHA